MIMRMTGAGKMSSTMELGLVKDTRKDFYTEEKQSARIRKRDFIFLPLMIATAIFLFLCKYTLNVYLGGGGGAQALVSGNFFLPRYYILYSI